MKKLLTILVLALIAGIGTSASAHSDERDSKKVQRPEIKVCTDASKTAHDAYKLAIKNAHTTFRTDMKAAKDTWRASDHGDAAKATYRAAKKVALDKFKASVKSARDAYKVAKQTRNVCIRNILHPSPTPTPSPTVTPSPTPTM